MSAQQPSLLGRYLREQRELARLSLREMSRLTDVSNAYLSQIERGLHAPSLRVLQALATALDVPVEELVRMVPGPLAPQIDSDRQDASDVESAIRRESRLSSDQKTALIAVFRSYLESKQERQQPGTPSAER